MAKPYVSLGFGKAGSGPHASPAHAVIDAGLPVVVDKFRWERRRPQLLGGWR